MLVVYKTEGHPGHPSSANELVAALIRRAEFLITKRLVLAMFNVGGGEGTTRGPGPLGIIFAGASASRRSASLIDFDG